MKLAGKLHHRLHLPDLVRWQKENDPSVLAPVGEDNLATIAYKDAVEDAVPSTTAWQSKPKNTRSMRRNSMYTEIVIPDYGNGLYNPSFSTTLDTLTSSNPTAPSSIPTTSPSNAYTRRSPSSPLTTSFPYDNNALPSPSPSTSTSTSTFSRHSDVPTLSSTYSSEGESPVVATPTRTAYQLGEVGAGGNADEGGRVVKPHGDDGHGQGLESADGEGRVKLVVAADGSRPDLIIETLISELQGCAVERETEV